MANYDARIENYSPEALEINLGDFDYVVSSNHLGFKLFRSSSHMYSGIQFNPIIPGWFGKRVEMWSSCFQSGSYPDGWFYIGENITITAIQDSSNFDDNIRTLCRKKIVYSKHGTLNYTLDVAELYRNRNFCVHKTIVRYMNSENSILFRELKITNFFSIMHSNQQMIARQDTK